MAGRFSFQCNILYVTLQFWTMCKYIYSKNYMKVFQKSKIGSWLPLGWWQWGWKETNRFEIQDTEMTRYDNYDLIS